jgi:Mlc titration factor MtfA (ptsG expression regulator)
MPPGDTLILNNLDELPDSIRQIVDSLMGLYSYQEAGEQKEPQYLLPEWVMFLILLSILATTAYFYIIRPASGQKRRVRKILADDSAGSAVLGMQYDLWLSKDNPYYKSLPADLKKRFIRRVVEFKESKQFIYHFMEPNEQCSVLISGAAIQLTFGLKRFLIQFFPVINVIKQAYTVHGRDKVLEGHVQVNNHSINISWNNFIADYGDYSDSENLGLHEMAHAISYDFLYGYQENRTAAFTARFKEYIQDARPVFKDLCQGRNDLLDDYGSLNVEEFWAVCIESFFENSEEFSRKLPDLYQSVADVLNQDPLKPGRILNKELAGLAN